MKNQRNNISRILSFALVCVVLCSVLLIAGCGGGNRNSNQSVVDGAVDDEVLQDVHINVTADAIERMGSFETGLRALVTFDIDQISLDQPLGIRGYFIMRIATTTVSENRSGEDIVVEVNLEGSERDNEALARRMAQQLNTDTLFASDFSAVVGGGALLIESKFLNNYEEITITFE